MTDYEVKVYSKPAARPLPKKRRRDLSELSNFAGGVAMAGAVLFLPALWVWKVWESHGVIAAVGLAAGMVLTVFVALCWMATAK